MRIPLLLLWFSLIGASSARSNASEVSRFLLSMSDVVLVGTITVAPFYTSGSAPIPSSDPQPYWSDSATRIKIDKVLKGKYTDSRFPLISLRIPMVASLWNQPSLPELVAPFAKGKKIIFFLQDRRLRGELGSAAFNDEPIHLVAFDQFFSTVPYGEALELEIIKQK